MAEEISDDRFKSEMMRMMNTAILKLGEHDKKFESLENKFDGLENKFDGLESKVDGLESKVGGVENKVGGLENKVGGLEQKIDRNTEEIISLKKDVKILTGQFTDVVGMVLEDNKRITKIEKDVEDLQSNIH